MSASDAPRSADPTPAAERLPWAPPEVTVIDLSNRTMTGFLPFDDETTFTSSETYAPTS